MRLDLSLQQTDAFLRPGKFASVTASYRPSLQLIIGRLRMQQL
jgi:hypothetical protein